MTRTTPRNILFVLNGATADGGALSGLLQLISALPDDQYRCYLALPRLPEPEQRAYLQQFFVDIAAVNTATWNIKPRRAPIKRLKAALISGARTGFRFRTLMQFRQLFRRWQIDLVYTSTLLVVDSGLAARLHGIPHIWHVKETFGRRGNTRIPLPENIVTGTVQALSSSVVVMTDYIGEPFVTHGHAQRMQRILDGLELAPYAGDMNGTALRERLGITDDTRLIGLVASLGSPWKRHDLFVEMTAQLHTHHPDLRFAHFGRIPTSGTAYDYYNDLRERIATAGLQDVFLWAGVVRDIPQMMDAIDILVHPCPTEPFGRVAIEAMAAGTPVVGPAAGGLRESVINGETGYLVAPEDAGALADAVAALLADPAKRQAMGARGRQHVQDVFGIQQHTQAIKALFDQHLEENR